MFMDTIDMTCEGERAHRRLTDFTWSNDGPPLNISRTLKQITNTDEANWGPVKKELLAKGWLEINEYFLHKGVIKSLNKSKEEYVDNHNRSAAMRKVFPLALSEPSPVTGCVTILVTSPVTSPVTEGQLESESESVPDPPPPKSSFGKGARGKPDLAAGEIPTIEQAITQTMTVGIPEDFTRYVFEDWQSRNGKDAGGVIVDWLPYVTKRWTRERTEWTGGTHRGKNDSKKYRKPNPTNIGMSESAAEKTADVRAILAARPA